MSVRTRLQRVGNGTADVAARIQFEASADAPFALRHGAELFRIIADEMQTPIFEPHPDVVGREASILTIHILRPRRRRRLRLTLSLDAHLLQEQTAVLAVRVMSERNDVHEPHVDRTFEELERLGFRILRRRFFIHAS